MIPAAAFDPGVTQAQRRVGVALASVGALVFAWAVTSAQPARGWGIYLVNFLFWSGLAQAGVAFSAILHLTRARWGGPLRGVAEAMSAFLPLSFALALLLPLGHASFYSWLGEAGAKERFWLSVPFLSARLVLGLLLLHGAGLLYLRRPALRDTLAPVVLIAYGVVLTLISFDWILSLDAHWFSTLIGGHYFVGSLYAALAAVALIGALSERRVAPEAGVRFAAAMHDQGKLLLGFCMLWMYLVFAQYLVIWYGDLPEETGFVLRRTAEPPWTWLSAFVLLSGFVLPFGLLLSRRLKVAPAGLATVAGLSLVAMFCERLLLVMPSLTKDAFAFGVVEAAVTAGFGASFWLCYASAIARAAATADAGE